MQFNRFALNGKMIIITGASSGIGRQCAVSCSRSGGKIILMGRNMERLKDTLRSTERKKEHIIVPIDLTDFEKVESVVRELVDKEGKIDGLINCAGVSTTLPLNMVRPDKMNDFFKTNVQTAINLTRIVARQTHFSEEGGSIIFISSVMAEVGESGKSMYSMTKGALTAGSRSLAIELAPRKIRVNCISPGVVETPMSKNAVYSQTEESMNKIKALHPLGLGQPEDIAYACIYLLSDASRWITGINLIADGGYTAR